MTKELIWISPVLGTTDYIDSEDDETIREVATRLLWKYNEQILEILNIGYSNVREAGLNMLTIKLYSILSGRKVPISLRDSISNVSKETSKIYWIPEPIGGR